MTLKSFKQIDGTLLTMTNFGSKGFGTIEPGNGTQEDQISFTGVVQNANGTATLTGVSQVLNVSPYTETAGVKVTHPGGVRFVISNTAGFYNTFANKTNNETVSGEWTFAGTTTFNGIPTTVAGTPVLPGDLVPLDFLTTVTTTGCANASTVARGCVEEATTAEVQNNTSTGVTGARLFISPSNWYNTLSSEHLAAKLGGETFSAGDILYTDSTFNTLKVANATSSAEVNAITAVAFEAGSIGVTGRVYLPGSRILYSSNDWSGGEPLYLTDAGRPSITPGTIRKVIGYAYDSLHMMFLPEILTPTSTPGAAFTPLVLGSDGTITTTILSTSTNASQVLRNIAAGATWDTLKSYSGNFTFTGSGAVTTTIGFEPKTINFSCAGQSGGPNATDGYWVSTGTQFTVGTTYTSGSTAQNEYSSGNVGAVRGGGGASYNQLTVQVSATSTSGFTVTATQANGPTTINCIYTAKEF
jgi:hypothetical protein